MTLTSLILFFGLLLRTITGEPWQETFPRCSSECPTGGSQKLFYETGMTYHYGYTGTSKVLVTNIEDADSEMNWKAEVMLTVLSPCDVAITISNPVWGDTPDVEGGAAAFLERYPLVAAMADGRIQQVCTHPDDDAWSINLKKGVASTLQNSLPSNSSVHSGITLIEADVVGKCPTLYDVKQEGTDKIVVQKTKNHRQCEERYPTPDELPIAWLNAPLPIGESISSCRQEITDGIITSVSCGDNNVIRPAYGIYKYIEAAQDSELVLLHISTERPSSISNLNDQSLTQKSLLYDYERKKDPSLVLDIDEVLKQICKVTEESIEKHAASLMAKALNMMRSVPDENIEQILKKIRSRFYCSSHQRLESLFLDALAFIREPGAVKVMVEELVSGRATRVRNDFYTAAFYLTARPNKKSIEALQPLFETSEPRLSQAVIGGSVMVSAYCRHNPLCNQEAPVIRLSEILSQEIEEKCSLSSGEQNQKEAVAALKALGNLGAMTPDIKRTVIVCLETEGLRNRVRISAAQSFRNVQCEQQPTKQLINIALDEKQDTEIRIVSYIAAVRCMHKEDLEYVISRITPEENEQVRGFILSHLINLQKSTAPHKENLRYHLSNIIVPNNFTLDVRKYSANADWSYFDASLGLGVGVESNLIYSPGSFFPRSIDLNLTSSVGGTLVNMGEYGFRTEGLDGLLRNLFGPGDSFTNNPSLNEAFRNFESITGEKSEDILENLKTDIRQERSIDSSRISLFLNKIYKRVIAKLPTFDAYARLNNQEIIFGSIPINPSKVDVNEHIHRFLQFLKGSIYHMTNANLDMAHMGQLHLQYQMPTIQGIPVKLKLDSTLVIGLKMETHLRNFDQRSNGPLLKLYPCASIQVDGFIGFDSFLAENGIKTTNSFSSNTGISLSYRKNAPGHTQFSVELPKRNQIFGIESEVYVTARLRGRNETKKIPAGADDGSHTKHRCVYLDMIGQTNCFEFGFPEPLVNLKFPFGRPKVVEYFFVGAPNLRGYHIDAEIQSNATDKELKMRLWAPGVESVTGVNGIVAYSFQQDSVKFSYDINYKNGANSIVWKSLYVLQNRDRIKSLELYSSDYNAFSPINHSVGPEYFQWELVDRSITSKKDVEFKYYQGSHPTLKKLQFLVKMAKEDRESDALINVAIGTQNELQTILDFNFETVVSVSKGSNPVRIQRFELSTSARRWKLITFLRPVEGSSSISAFRFFIDDVRVCAIDGKHSITRREKDLEDLQNDITGVFGNALYKLVYNLHNSPIKRGTLLRIIQGSSDTTIAHFEALHEKSGSTYKTKLQVEIPTHMKPLCFENVAVEREHGTYNIEATLKHGEQLMVHYGGHVKIILTPTLTHFQTDMGISSVGSGPYKIATDIIFSEKKQLLAFNFRNPEAPLFGIEWKVVSEEQADYGFHLQLKSIIDNTVRVSVGQHFMHVAFENIIKPETHGTMRTKGFADADFVQKKASCEFSWDVDNDPTKKFKTEITLAKLSSSLLQFGAYGGWELMGDNYHFKTDVDIKDPRMRFVGNNILKFTFTTPNQKNLAISTDSQIRYEDNDLKMDTLILYKNVDSQDYKLVIKTSLDDLAGKFNYMLINEINYKPPEREETVVHLEARHQTVAGLGEIFLQMKMMNPSLVNPIDLVFMVNKKQHAYNAVWDIELDTPARGFNFELVITPERGLKIFDLGVDLTAITNLLKAFRRVLDNHKHPQEHHLVVGSPKKLIYQFHYDQIHPYSSVIKLQIPSRILGMEIHSSPSEYIISFNPDEGKHDSKYEFHIGKPHGWSPWHQELSLKGQFKHPRLTKDMVIDIHYKKTRDGIVGKVDLDILPDARDKITGSFTSIQMSDNSVNIEVHISGRILKTSPKITVTAAHTSQTIALDLTVQTISTDLPALYMSGKLDRSSGSNVALAFKLATHGNNQIYISGALAEEDRSTCEGLRFAGKSHSQTAGIYDIDAQLCLPGAIQLMLKSQDVSWSHKMTVGMRGLKTAEFSIEIEDQAKLETKPVMIARAELTSPRLVSLDLRYDSKEQDNVKRSLAMKYLTISREMENWIRRMGAELIRYDTNTYISLAEMTILWNVFKDEASLVYGDIVSDYNVLKDTMRAAVLRNQLTVRVRKNYQALSDQLIQVLHRITVVFFKGVTVLFKETGDVDRHIEDVIRASIHYLQTGEMPQKLSYTLRLLKESSIYRILEKEVCDFVPWYIDADRYVVATVWSKTIETVKRDLDSLRTYLIQVPELKENMNRILKNMDIEHWIVQHFERIIYRTVQESMMLSLDLEPNRVQVLLPLRVPANSLLHATKDISFNPLPILDSAPWSNVASKFSPSRIYKSYWPYALTSGLTPYNRTAMLIGDHEILTFDGRVLRAPNSHCSVILLVYGSNSLTMEHAHGLIPSKLTLVVPGATVLIQPDYRVTLNGHEISGHHKLQDVQIWQTPTHIEVEIPFLKLRVRRDVRLASIELNGWVYGQVAGLLGTYDGEAGNDWLMPSGAKATSLQQLVMSWQEDQHCRVPQINSDSSIDASIKQLALCQVMLGIPSSCNGVIDPEPFIRICYGTKNPCDAVQAYHSLCSDKGVLVSMALAC